MAQMENGPLFGCVADDLTGAGDIASFLVEAGASCLLLDGVPGEDIERYKGYDAIVVALKSRSAPPDDAVRECGKSFDWLKAMGATTLYFKYCSTFDSTPEGNIGPVLDDLLERYDLPYTILCPALPVNGREVRNGRLLVNGVPLHESHMKNHPLNPMWDCRIDKLMEAQSRYRCFVLDSELLSGPKAELEALIDRYKRENPHFYLVVDYFEESHGDNIAKIFAKLPLLSGGSALAGYLVRSETGAKPYTAPRLSGGDRRGIILAGSCSEATLGQIRHFTESGGASIKIEPASLADGSQTDSDIWDFIEAAGKDDVLVYSSDTHENVLANQKTGRELSARLIEETMARLGRRAVDSGIRNVIVAGGETSGAVIGGLQNSAYRIGEAIAPGVPVLYPLNYPEVRLVLKSGNFGQVDFFTRAMRQIRDGGNAK